MPWPVRIAAASMVGLVSGLALSSASTMYNLMHWDSLWVAGAARDDSMHGAASEHVTWLIDITGLVFAGLTVVVLTASVRAMLRGRRWGYLVTGTIAVVYAITFGGLVGVGVINDGTSCGSDPNCLAPIYLANTPAWVGRAGTVGSLLLVVCSLVAAGLLAAPTTRRTFRPTPPVAQSSALESD